MQNVSMHSGSSGSINSSRSSGGLSLADQQPIRHLMGFINVDLDELFRFSCRFE